MISDAEFSPCRTWRYQLRRLWGDGALCLFVGLNPSTADEEKDDPTVRRCIRFAQEWGYGGLIMSNIFAYRATDPKVLLLAADPVGPDTDGWLTRQRYMAGLVICAWGVHGTFLDRGKEAVEFLRPAHCLGRTKDGHPRHPLYLSSETRPELFASRR